MFGLSRYQCYTNSIRSSHACILSGLCASGLIVGSIVNSGATVQEVPLPPAGNPPAEISLPPLPPRPMEGAAIAANGDSLYVLQGNSLLRLRASNLSILAQQEIPVPSSLPIPPPLSPPSPLLPGTRGGVLAPPATPLPNAGSGFGHAANRPAPLGAGQPLPPGAPMPGMPGMPAPIEGPAPPAASALTVSNNTVYLLLGNTVYRFRASDLKLLGQAELPVTVAPIATQGSSPSPQAPIPPPAEPGAAVPPPPGNPGVPPH